MRVLLLSANTGEGHNSTAKAVMGVLESRGVECTMADTLAFLSPGFSKFICDWHVRLYRHGRKLFDLGYRFAELTSNPDEFNPIYELLALGAAKMRDWIREGDYDAILCSHAFAGVMVTEVRRSWGLEIPSYFVSTDYTCHPTVEQCDLDGYFISAKGQIGEFTVAGIPEEKVIVSGIPVRQDFYTRGDKASARQALELPENATVVLLMCGSMGCGPIPVLTENLMSRLHKDAYVVAVCGSNESLYHHVLAIQDDRLRVLGFTDRISDYMDAADLIITKPGGLSSTEAANKALPMVFVNFVGGCESRNFNFFLEKGYAAGSAVVKEAAQIAADLASDGARRQAMSQALAENFTVNSGLFIADYLMDAGTKYRNKQKETAGVL